MNILLDILKIEVEMRDNLIPIHPLPLDFNQSSIYHVVQKFGQHYRKQALPSRFKKMEEQFCFGNCAKLAKMHNDLIYVEGFGIVKDIPHLVHHAWCVVAGTNKVIEPTCTDFTNYFGIPFKTKVLKRKNVMSGVSLLDNWYDDWPLLKKTDQQLKQLIRSEECKTLLSKKRST